MGEFSTLELDDEIDPRGFFSGETIWIGFPVKFPFPVIFAVGDVIPFCLSDNFWSASRRATLIRRISSILSATFKKKD